MLLSNKGTKSRLDDSNCLVALYHMRTRPLTAARFARFGNRQQRPLWALSRLAAAQRVKFEPRSGSGHSQIVGLLQFSSGWPIQRTFGNREQKLREVGLNVRPEP